MSYPVINIANKVLANTNMEQGDTVSNLKLQKILYYLQGYFMAVFGRKLFDNAIEAWNYGPVVREVYFHFNKFGSGAITLQGEEEIAELLPEEEELFLEVLEEYGQFSAIKLMKMTHEELPWKQTWHTNPQSEISDALILEFFKTQIQA